MAAIRFVFQAGVGGSEPAHWQSIWARERADVLWVDHDDWDRPVRDAWVARLEAVLHGTPGPKVIVAHSLGCLLVAEAAHALKASSVAGAFLVAVPDVAAPCFPASAVGFRSALSLPMPVPSIVVASSDDPYGSLEHAREVARRWGSELAGIGAKGHINASSGLGSWAEGRMLLEEFVGSL